MTMPRQLLSVPFSAFPNRHRVRTVSDKQTREGSGLVAADCLVREGADVARPKAEFDRITAVWRCDG